MEAVARVLVVDDEPVVCGGITRVLQRHGYAVDIALGGAAALEKIRDQPAYDVLLVDIMMPQMNGLDLLAALKEQRVSSRVVIITGLGTARSAMEAFRLGAFDYVTKPFTSEELLSATARAASPEASRGEERPLPSRADFFRLGVHSWVCGSDGGTALVGIHDSFQRTAGRLVAIDLPNEGDDLAQGELCARVRVEGGGVYNVWCPISGRVAEINLDLNRDPSRANRDPYGEGWLFRVFPERFEEETRELRPRPGVASRSPTG